MIRVSSQSPLLVEQWSARITETTPDASKFSFEVFGSKTGADGSGRSDRPFVSTSRRVVIQPEHWWLRRAWEYSKKELAAGFEIRWEVKPLYADAIQPVRSVDAARETSVTIAQGLPNTKHRLELRRAGSGGTEIRALRVWQPPAR